LDSPIFVASTFTKAIVHQVYCMSITLTYEANSGNPGYKLGCWTLGFVGAEKIAGAMRSSAAKQG